MQFTNLSPLYSTFIVKNSSCFCIFSKKDELIQFKDSFDKIFQYKEEFYQNSILIKGHHSNEEEYLADGLKQAEKYF